MCLGNPKRLYVPDTVSGAYLDITDNTEYDIEDDLDKEIIKTYKPTNIRTSVRTTNGLRHRSAS